MIAAVHDDGPAHQKQEEVHGSEIPALVRFVRYVPNCATFRPVSHTYNFHLVYMKGQSQITACHATTRVSAKEFQRGKPQIVKAGRSSQMLDIPSQLSLAYDDDIKAEQR